MTKLDYSSPAPDRKAGKTAIAVSIIFGTIAFIGLGADVALAILGPVRNNDDNIAKTALVGLLAFPLLICSLISVVAGLVAIARSESKFSSIVATIFGALPLIVVAILAANGQL